MTHFRQPDVPANVSLSVYKMEIIISKLDLEFGNNGSPLHNLLFVTMKKGSTYRLAFSSDFVLMLSL